MAIGATVSSETVRRAYAPRGYDPRVSRKRGLSDAQIVRVRAAMRALRDGKYEENATALGAALGISHAAEPLEEALRAPADDQSPEALRTCIRAALGRLRAIR